MTPAIDQLERLGVAFTVRTYEHDPSVASFGDEAAAALGLDPATVFKTLVATGPNAQRSQAKPLVMVALVPVTGRLDLKALATAASIKKASLADPALAERTTGYIVGGISPLGQRRTLPTFIDRSALALEVIRVSAGRRGVEVELAPSDLIQALNATTAPLQTNPRP